MANSIWMVPDNSQEPQPTDEENRTQRLNQAKQRKLDHLSKTNNMASLDDSYTDFGDGLIESNQNKIWNEMDANDIQSVQGYGLNQYGLTPDDEGVLRFSSGEAYEGPTRRLYSFNTPEGEYKYGTARGDLTGSEERYTPNEEGTYGWAPGPRGVDVNQKNQDALLPENVANILEGLAHGRREAFDARSVRDIYTDPDTRTPYGSGVSEYYTSQEGLFGAPQEVDSARGKELLDNYIQTFQEKYPEPLTREERVAQIHQQLQEAEANNADLWDRVGNTASAFSAALTNELFVKPTEAVGDLTGWYDISGTTEDVENFFGYNPILEQRAMEEIKTDWQTIMSDDASTADKVRAGMNGAFTAFTTPEMLGSSFGVIAAWAMPGGLLSKLFGKGTKYATKLAEIRKLETAGDITSMAARGRKIAAFKEAGATANALRKQSGHIVAALGNVNEQYNEFVQNNGGVELTGADKAAWFAGRMSVQVVNQNLDKLVAFDIIKSPGIIKSLIPMAKSFTSKEFSNIAKQAAKGVLVSTKSVGEEAAQEYSQTMMELFNSRYGSETFKDQDTFKEFLSDERNLTEAGVAALAGAGGAGQFEVVGGVVPITGGLASSIGDAGQAVSDKLAAKKADGIKTNIDDVEKPTTEEETKTAKRQYGELLARVGDEVRQGKVTQDNIGTYLDDIDELNRSRHVMADSSPEGKQAEEAVYNEVITHLEKLVNENSDKPLTKRIVRKTVQESAQDKADKEFAGLPTEVTEAFQAWDSVGFSEPRNISKVINSTVEEIKKAETLDELIDDPIILAPAIQQLEQALTGAVSEDIDTSFANVKTYLTDNDVKTKIDPNFVAGAGPTVIEEEQAYDDHTRAVDAERVITTLLGSSRTYDDTFIEKVAAFAKNNNISEKKFKDIVKSFESVEEEAVRGPRGYKTRLLRLKGLVESTNPQKKVVDTELNSIVRMQSDFDKAVTQLEGGITGAERKAAELNKQKVTRKKIKPIVTEYTKANGKKFDISIVYKNGTWVALTENAQKLVDTKKRYSQEIRTELRTISSRAATTQPGVLPDLGTFVAPTRKKKAKGERPIKGASFFKRIGEALASVGVGSEITKVIVGEKPTSDFEAKGAYRTANSILVNNDDYDADDVVLVSDDNVQTSKSKKNFLHKLFSGKDADIEKLTEPQQMFRAALEAGVTFIVDPDMKKNAKEALKGRLINQHGYMALDGYTGHILVKETDENKAILQEQQAELTKKAEEKATKAQNKEALITASLALKYKVDPVTGEALTDAGKATLNQTIVQLTETVVQESFDGDTEKFNTFVKNRLVKDVKDLATEQLTAGEDAVPLDVPGNKGLEEGAKQYINAELDRMSDSQQVLADWKNAVEVEQARGKERESIIKKLLEKVGAVPQALAKMVKERSFAVGKNDVFEERYTVINYKGKKREVTKMVRKERSPEDIQRLTTDGERRGQAKEKYILLDVRRVTQNPFKLVNLTKTTVLNSLATAQLPFGIQDNVEKFQKVIFKALKFVEEPELDEQTDRYKEGTTTFKDGNYNLYNSPARGFIFNEDGKPNEQVLAAMYVALADMMKTDLGKLLRGYKSDADIALMFGIQEHEVTREMRQHAKDHGTFFKTVANTLGKGVLQQLGFTKTDIGTSGEYESFVADLGNSLIAIGEKSGLLNITSEESNKIANWFRDGKVLETDAKTYFVNVTDQDEKVGKYTRKVPTEAITTFVNKFKEVVEELPESSTTRVEYTFQKPSEEQLDKAKTTVRNDLFDRHVPEAAKGTLETLMNTGYEANLERITEFLDAVAATDSQIKKHLGYIAIGSTEYDNLYAGDKDVQEAKNRAIDKTIEELTLLKDRLERYQNEGKPVPELFFEYFYASNDRYMMDSNTINPQVDKIVRFLVVPSAHRLTYDVEINQNTDTDEKTKRSGFLFTVDGEDQSYMVRLALAQAFGQGVDKMSAQQVIEFSDALLGLTDAQLDVVKAGLLKNNKHKIQIQGAPTALKLEAEHITHTLQAIDFLRQVGTGTVNSSLSLEFDSLTSGFANKVQQMPILKNMGEHLARVGILTQEQIRRLKENFDPKTGDSIATILAEGKDIGFYDSYQSLAIKVTDILSGKNSTTDVSGNLVPSTTGKGSSGVRLYEAIKSLLPGSDIIETKQNYRGGENQVIDIDSKLRNLFKPPFMIFNYSAGINRITKNLGFEVSDDIAGKIATADFAGEDADLKAVVTEIMKSVGKLYYKETGSTVENPINTAEELQTALRKYSANQIMLKVPFKVNNTEKARTQSSKDFSKNLGDVLSEVVTLTYGEAVKGVFESEFEAFIKVQDAMNDTYKIAFRIFDQKRMEKLSTLRLAKADKTLTAQDHAQVLEELWDDFPWIVGPLTGSKDKKSVKKDVIAVATTAVTSPSEIERARVNPQISLGTGFEKKQRGVTPLVRYMEEAVSAGSVLPFHAIDGAEIGYLINKLGINGVAAIHDAVLVPLTQADLATFLYQEGMQKINAGGDPAVGFSLSQRLGELVERIEKTLTSKDFAKTFEDVKIKGLKLAEKNKQGEVTENFPQAATRIIAQMRAELKNIDEKREEYYGEGGKLTGAWYGNMVGSPASMFQVGMTEPDLSYKETFKDSYSSPTVLENVKEEDTETVAEANQTAEQKTTSETKAATDDIKKGCPIP